MRTKSNQNSSEEGFSLPKYFDHKTDDLPRLDEDEEKLGLAENVLILVSNASSLPGNGTKNLAGQILILSKCTDHS